MKGRYLALIVILTFFGAAIVGIIFFSRSSTTKYERTTQSTKTTLRALIESGAVESQFDSTDLTSTDYIEEIIITFDSKKHGQTFLLKAEPGKDLSKGDAIYSYLQKEFLTDFNGRLVDYDITSDYAKLILLNFDKQYIESHVDIKKLDMIKIGAAVKLQIAYGNRTLSEPFEGIIAHVGYIVDEDGKVPVKITTSRHLLPGTKVKTTYIATNPKPSLYILKKLLQQDTDGSYYLTIEKSDYTQTKRIVEIGETFISYNNDSQAEYVEILSGACEGEKAVINIIELDNGNRSDNKNE